MDFLKLGLFTFFIGTFFFSLLMLVNQSRSVFLKRLFTIPARKSVTDAIQLGGLPLSFAILCGIGATFVFFSYTANQSHLLKYWAMASLVVIAYGHLDDKYELRPIVKLCMQIFAVCLFALPASQNIYPHWSALSFVFIGFWSMGVLNGGNLLDGLDTLSIKLGSVTFGVIFSLSFWVGADHIMALATIGLFALASFYYFNREPALVHLGEIGGSFIGFYSLLCSCLLFEHTYMSSFFESKMVALSMSLLPLLLPMCELAISFSRRIYNRKSPFKGDIYHLHHILRNHYKFSPTLSSTIFASGYMIISVSTLSLSYFLSPVLGFFLMTTLLLGCYISVGRKHWKSNDTLDLKPTSLFQYLQKKDVTIINSLEFDQFTIEVRDQAFEEIDFDKLEEEDSKKAA